MIFPGRIGPQPGWATCSRTWTRSLYDERGQRVVTLTYEMISALGDRIEDFVRRTYGEEGGE